MTDEELDKLFKDAAENFRNSNPPEGAWEAFYTKNEQKLKEADEELPMALRQPTGVLRLFQKYIRVAAVLLIIIAGAFAWYITSEPGRDKTAIVENGAPDSQPNNNNQVTNNKVKDSAYGDNQLSNEQSPMAVVTPGHFSTSQQNRDNQVSGQMEVITNVPFQTPGNGLVAPPETVSQNRQDKPAVNPVQPAERKRIDLGINNQQSGNNNNYNPFLAGGKEKQRPVSGGKWQIGIVGGTNIAMVKGDISATPGLNTGIVVQRRISDSRVSLESGVIYENMTYAVENEYFNPGGKPVSAKVSNISGTCTMIDVPVNVRYDMVHSKKRKAFVSTGVSPTVMVKQSYVYDYTDDNGTRLIDRDVTGQGKSFYAVANVSVGYEQKWNKTSVQVAPYLKIPMGEIGYGNLSLGGIGTQVSIKRDL